MPPLVAIAAAYIADAIAVAADYSFVAYGIAEAVASAVMYAGISYGLGAAFKALETTNTTQSLTDRMQLIKASRSTRRVVYGEVRTSGTLVFANSTDTISTNPALTANAYLHIVIALAGHQCEAIETVYLNEEPLVEDSTVFETTPAWDVNNAGYVEGNIVFDLFSIYSNPGKLYQRTNVLYTIPSGGPNSPPLNDSNSWIVIGDSRYFPLNPNVGQTWIKYNGGPSITPSTTWNTLSLGTLGFPEYYTGLGAHSPGGPEAIGTSVYNAILAAGGYYIKGSRQSVLIVNRHLGSSTQTADTDLIANCPLYWTTNHRLQGITYIYVMLTFAPNIWTGGIPNVSAVLKGKNDIYDPRTTTSGFSSNWALCNANYLTSPVTQGCLGGNYNTDIDEAVLIANANISDEQVQYGGPGTGDIVPSTTALYRNRYTCNGTIDTGLRPLDILTSLMSAGAGTIIWTGGLYQIFAAAYESPSYSLTENDLRDKIQVFPRVSKKDLFNTIGGSYVDPLQHWQATTFPRQTGSAWVTEDGGELLTNIEMPYTTNAYEAQTTALLMLRRARNGMTVNFPGKFTCLPIRANSVINLSISQLGWVNLEFRVLSWKLAANGQGVDLVLQLEDSNAYTASQADLSYVNIPTMSNLPSPWYVAQPTNLTVAESLYYVDGIKGIATKVIFAWDDVLNNTYEVQAFYGTDTEFHTIGTPSTSLFTIYNVPNGVIQLQVRAINSIGSTSSWRYTNYNVLGKTAPPANVTDLSAILTLNQLNISWTPIADIDLLGYEIQIGTVWDGTGNLILCTSYYGTSFNWTLDRLDTVTILVKAIDTSGNYSATEARFNFSVPALPSVSNVNDYYILPFAHITWQALQDFRPFVYEIRFGINFATAMILGTTSITDFTASSNGTYWIVGKFTVGNNQFYSSTPAEIIIGGSVLVQNVVQSFDELATGWSGALSSAVEIDGSNRVWLKTVSGVVQPAGTYTIPTGHIVDVGSVKQCQLSVQYTASSDMPSNQLDSIPDFDSIADFDGNYAGFSNVQIQVQVHNGTAWGIWMPFIAGYYTGQKFNFGAVLTSSSPQITAVLSAFAFTVDMPDRTDTGTSVSVGTGGQAVAFATSFNAIPNVQVTVLNAQAGDTITFPAATTAAGFTVEITNGGSGVARSINWLAQGY